MIKEVKYRGVTTTPSDYESPDGDLATSSNVVVDGDKLVVTKEPDNALDDSYTFTHKPIFKHVTVDNNVKWVTYGTNTLYIYPTAVTEQGETVYREVAISDLTLAGEPKSIQAIGNTLVVVDSVGTLHYVVYRNGEYKYLGDHIPTVQIQFGLRGMLERRVEENLDIGVHLEGAQQATLTIPYGSEDTVTKYVMGEIEQAMKTLGDDNDKFSAPFLVRFALKLYDGSYTNISVPVMMDNNYGKTPVVGFFAQGTAGVLRSFSVYNVYSNLQAKLVSSIRVLDGWEDIVKSIDIFVSEQFHNYNALEKVDGIIPYYGDNLSGLETSPMGDAYSTNKWVVLQGSSPGYLKRSFFNMFANYFNDYAESNERKPRYIMGLPYYSDDELTGEQRGKIALNSTFYKLYSYQLTKIQEIGSSHYGNELLVTSAFNTVPVESGVIANIKTQQNLPDDYYSNDQIAAGSSYVYNSKLMLAAITRTPFAGFNPDALVEPLKDDQSGATLHTADVAYTVLLDENGRKIKVETSAEDINVIQDQTYKYFGIIPTYFYYPNPNAKTLVVDVSIDGGNTIRRKIDLLPHPTLNGAYYVSRDSLNLAQSDTVDMSAYTDVSVEYPNVIYSSEVYNPYVFKASGVNEIGGGASILSLVSNTQALSQGQFGQFPLYAFTTLGIWALELSKAGEFTGLYPVTRDIILGDGESLTQLDDSLLFATKQGIMELVGKNTKCLTTKLDKALSLPNLVGKEAITGGTTPVVPDIKTFVNGCQMVYDYIHARVIVFKEGSNYVYVYSAKDDSWTLMPVAGLIDTINSFPDPLAVAEKEVSGTTKYALIDLSTITDESGVGGTANSGWFITRPIDLDAPNDFKLIDVVRQNGVFEEYLIKDEQSELYEGKSAKTDGHTVIEQILYGSNDLINWFVIGSSDSRLINGRTSAGFKWFRLAVKSTLKPGESISSVTFSYRIKAENPHLF